MHNWIVEIAIARGNEKQEVLSRLKNNTPFKRIIKYVYDPDLKYHMTAPITVGIHGGAPIDRFSFDLLDRLATRDLSGQRAMEVICDYIAQLNPENADLFKKIINKDLRMGVGLKTIHKMFPGLIEFELSAQLVKNIKKSKIKYPCFVSGKYDGVRGLNEVSFKTRAGKVLKGLDHLETELLACSAHLDGELMVAGVGFDEGSGLIRNHKPTPDAYYMVFDAPSIPGPLHKRIEWLQKNLKQSRSIKLIPHVEAHDLDDIIAFYNHCLSMGLEGIVIKDMNSEYTAGKSYDWMRLCPVKTADCLVTGWFEGKGKFVNMMGGIIVDYKGKPCKVGTGFKDHERDISMAPDYTGRIAECEFKEETKAGSMRQPRFKGWRWDKKETD